MQATYSKLNILLFMLVALQLISTGCKYFSKLETRYLISLHELANDDMVYSQLSRTVWDPQQIRQVRINAYAFLDARSFYQAVVTSAENSSNCGIRLYFDRFGHNTLLQAAAQKQGQPFAVLIDGFFVGFSDFPNRLDGLSWLELPPLWSAMEAEQIVDYIPKNYRRLN